MIRDERLQSLLFNINPCKNQTEIALPIMPGFWRLVAVGRYRPSCTRTNARKSKPWYEMWVLTIRAVPTARGITCLDSANKTEWQSFLSSSCHFHHGHAYADFNPISTHSADRANSGGYVCDECSSAVPLSTRWNRLSWSRSPSMYWFSRKPDHMIEWWWFMLHDAMFGWNTIPQSPPWRDGNGLTRVALGPDGQPLQKWCAVGKYCCRCREDGSVLHLRISCPLSSSHHHDER